MSAPPYVRFYGNDWFTGCAALKADERGVYISMCVYVWTVGKRVPLDDAEAARAMNLQFNLYQRVRDKLLRLEKVTRHVDGYGNDRAEFEFEKASQPKAETGSDLPFGQSTSASTWRQGRTEQPTAGGAQPNGASGHSGGRSTADENAPPNDTLLGAPQGAPMGACQGAPIGAPMGDNEKNKQNQYPSREPSKEPKKEEVVVEARALARNDLKAIGDRLTDIAGPVLKNPAASPGLLNFATIAWWIEKGLNVETDIAPAIENFTRANCAKPFRVASWEYFTPIIMTAKALRDRPLPEAAVTPPARSSDTRPQWQIDRSAKIALSLAACTLEPSQMVARHE